MPRRGTGLPRQPRKPLVDLGQQLTTRFPALFNAIHIPEPQLTFNGHTTCADPKTGLASFGPWSLNSPAPPTQVRVGIIGTGETISLAEAFLSACKNRVDPVPVDGEVPDPVLFPSFPGLSKQSPFGCELVILPNLQETISPKELAVALANHDFSKRVAAVAQILAGRLAVLKDKETPPEVVVCALPKEVEESCRLAQANSATPQAGRMQNRILRQLRQEQRKGQMTLFDIPTTIGLEEEDPGHRNLHRAFKALAMGVGLKTQLVWHSTLIERKGLQDRATRAWNLGVGLYYKAGGIPWKTSGLRAGTCYVGIAFYQDRSLGETQMRTSMAQVFSEEGEGIVLRGEPFAWDPNVDRTPHLTKPAAESLLAQSIKLYRAHWKREPNRVVVHKSSRFWPEELQGFEQSLGQIQFYDFLALSHQDKRFLRLGYEPPVRGTMIELAPRNYLFYTRGYVPFMGTYPGHHIPDPLEVLEHHGTTSMSQIGAETLALSKLNWNTADFSCGDPITIAFARRIGHILSELPGEVTPQASYRFYM